MSLYVLYLCVLCMSVVCYLCIYVHEAIHVGLHALYMSYSYLYCSHNLFLFLTFSSELLHNRPLVKFNSCDLFHTVFAICLHVCDFDMFSYSYTCYTDTC